jgi:hypothetical protein
LVHHEEVRVEAAAHPDVAGSSSFALREQHRARVSDGQPLAQLPPQLGRPRIPGIVLDQRVGHVDTETGDAAVAPVADDLPERGPVGLRPRSVDGLSPRLLGIEPGVAEVEGRLLVEEVLQVVAGSRPW